MIINQVHREEFNATEVNQDIGKYKKNMDASKQGR